MKRLRLLGLFATSALLSTPAVAGMAPVRASRGATTGGALTTGPLAAVADGPSFDASLITGFAVAPAHLNTERQAAAFAAGPAAPFAAVTAAADVRVIPTLLPLPALVAPGAPSPVSPESVERPAAPATPSRAPAVGIMARAETTARGLAAGTHAAADAIMPAYPPRISPVRAGVTSLTRTPAMPQRALTDLEKARFGLPREGEFIGSVSANGLSVAYSVKGHRVTRVLDGSRLLRITGRPGRNQSVVEVSLDGGRTWQADDGARAASAGQKAKLPERLFGLSKPPAANPVTEQAARMWGSIEDFWLSLFPELAEIKNLSTLIIFTEKVKSPYGVVRADSGPFYAPTNKNTYLPLEFYDMLVTRLNGDNAFARLVVLAHEYGHHIQNHMGIQRYFTKIQNTQSTAVSNRVGVLIELHADSLAGFYAAHAERVGVAEAGDVESAMNAIVEIGDDTLQRKSGRTISPRDFTHGSSAQRTAWFERGRRAHSLRELDPFSDPALTAGLPDDVLASLRAVSAIIRAAPLGY